MLAFASSVGLDACVQAHAVHTYIWFLASSWSLLRLLEMQQDFFAAVAISCHIIQWDMNVYLQCHSLQKHSLVQISLDFCVYAHSMFGYNPDKMQQSLVVDSEQLSVISSVCLCVCACVISQGDSLVGLDHEQWVYLLEHPTRKLHSKSVFRLFSNFLCLLSASTRTMLSLIFSSGRLTG